MLPFILPLAAAAAAAPNIIFVLTDDQDVLLDSLNAMPNSLDLFTKSGITFSNAFATTSVCCPSRSALLTGRTLHNNGCFNNSLSGNCSSPSWQATSEKSTFATLLKKAGYKTFFGGKYLNQYGNPQAGGTAHIPPGWDDWHGLVGNSVYYNYTISNNGVAAKHGDKYPQDYLPLVALNFANTFIRKHVQSEPSTPFFAEVSLPSCHDPLDAEPQYQGSFDGIKAPRTASYNVPGVGKEWFVNSRHELSAMEMHYTDMHYRKRQQTLQTVDDIIMQLVKLTRELGVDDNTYLIFTADNGYHLGQFRVLKDKRLPYETDIRVPFFVLPPTSKARGVVVPAMVTLIDLAPTFADLAGIAAPVNFDGKSFAPLLKATATGDEDVNDDGNGDGNEERIPLAAWRDRFLVEYHGEGDDKTNMSCYNINSQSWQLPPYWDGPTIPHCEDARNNTYWCERVINDKDNFLYCEFAQPQIPQEYYDFNKDPHQLSNVFPSLGSATQAQLHRELVSLKACVGADCFVPGKIL